MFMRFFLGVVAVSAIVGMTGASSSAHADQNTDPSCTISASVSSVAKGGSTTITWQGTNADSGWISDLGDVDDSGSRVVSNVSDDMTFTYTVYGNGKTATCTKKIYVDEEAAPSCSLKASDNSIASGSSVVLRWDSTNAESAHLSGVGSIAVQGRYTVYPKSTTTYTVLVYGTTGQVSQCQTKIYVDGSTTKSNQAPTCSVTLTNYGNGNGYDRSAMLKWSSTNATSAYLTLIGAVETNGAKTIFYPDLNSIYTLTVSGPGGSVSCETTGATYTNGSYGGTYNNGSYNYVNAPYVYLSQIPYTGLDFGPMGTMVYFLALALFAIAGGYLLVYYNGGMLRFSFAQEVKVAMRNQARALRSIVSK
jgi:hypothetical protein